MRTIPLALLVALAALPGCFRDATRESGKPAIAMPTTDGIRTKLANLQMTANPSPDSLAVQLVVKPLESTGAPGSRCLVIASVVDSEGQPRRQKKIEWSLDGVGSIDSVDQGSYLTVLERKPQTKYGVSYTSALARTIKGEAGEDITLPPGQTWCILTSESEGDARLTVHCPEIAGAAARERFVIRRWADVAWQFPPNAAAPAGSQPTLVTQVVRASDRQPVGNYRVRYRLIDGAPAQFLPNRAQETEVEAVNGQGRVTIAELDPRPGNNRIAVEVVQVNPSLPNEEPTVIARGETVVHWQSPQASLSLNVPSAIASGQELPVVITMTNAGKLAAESLSLRMPVPPGTTFVRSEPQARDENGQLSWLLPTLPVNGTQSVTAVFKTSKPDVVQFAVALQGRDGLFVQQRATTRVATAQLLVDWKAPPTAAPNEPITLDATVTNAGAGPAANVVLRAAFDEGLEHPSQANPLEVKIGTIEPGKTRSVPLTLTAKQMGQFRVRLTAYADGNQRGEVMHALAVSGKLLSVQLSGPASRYVDRTGNWDVRIGNPGSVPLTNVMLRVQLPPELECRAASNKGQYAARSVVWPVGTLLANEFKSFQLTAAATQLTAQSPVTAGASADGVAEQSSTASIEVLGVPAVRVEIVTPGATAPVKGRATYRIVVHNRGSLAARNLVLNAEMTASVIRPLAATGPTIGRINGDAITFEPLDRLDAKQTATFMIEAEAMQPGDGRIKVTVKSDHAPTPAHAEEATQVVPAPK